ncbi:MAG: UbiD family decarboxylase [Proteobacteria bacterium]|nr:UbiD family decarboxylase [Pseudomonadota bacterium]
MIKNIPTFLSQAKDIGQVLEIDAEVDPYLELAEIHRRVIERNGPVLLFKNVRGSSFPVTTNLFGTKERVDLAFGKHGYEFISQAVELVHELMPLNFTKLWDKKKFFFDATKLGFKVSKNSNTSFKIDSPANLDKLPIITSWVEDGGPFVTLPLVYTEDPELKVGNLGMYRMHKYDQNTTGMHMQIGKGGGFHLAKAKKLKQNLPLNVFLGGPPALIVSAIAPLPENVPELVLASLLLGEKLKLNKSTFSELPYPLDCEFVLMGSVNPEERRPEGPFGDHYGYYSLEHDFPVFHCNTVLYKENAIYPATVVGKPRQEDYYIGNYLQELLSPLFPLVMPAVETIWSYGETGYHSLAAAVVKERYKRECMSTAFRILGEGQLALTKFLLLIDKKLDLQNFPEVLKYILERCDFRKDFYIFSNLSLDTLDYTGPKLNEGSRAVMLGIGDPIRTLPTEFTFTNSAIKAAKLFCPGCLVVSGENYSDNPKLAAEISQLADLKDWPLIFLVDDVEFSSSNSANFLWSTFTRFEPAADIFASNITLERFHPLLHPPIVIDARMKPSYPGEVLTDEKTFELVNKRWEEYFSKEMRDKYSL